MPEDNNETTRLILADGTILENCDCGYSSKNLWCFLRDIPFSEAFQYFSGPEKFDPVICEMVFGDVTHRTTYKGLEHIVTVHQGDSTVDVRLEGYRVEIIKEKIINSEAGEQTS